jgi:protein-S-isoprenylcysteine O-methyltransferase Ste14
MHRSRHPLEEMCTGKKFTLLILLLAILYLLISGSLLSWSPIVIIGQLLAAALAIWARRSFQPDQFSIHAEPKEGQLLLRGLYQYIRHPMYAAALLLIKNRKVVFSVLPSN